MICGLKGDPPPETAAEAELEPGGRRQPEARAARDQPNRNDEAAAAAADDEAGLG